MRWTVYLTMFIVINKTFVPGISHKLHVHVRCQQGEAVKATTLF